MIQQILMSLLTAYVALVEAYPWILLLTVVLLAVLFVVLWHHVTEPWRERERQEIREKQERGELPPHTWMP